jgi:hypothetical protein
VIDGYMLCNYIVRNGKEIFPKRAEYLKFKVGFSKKKSPELPGDFKENI